MIIFSPLGGFLSRDLIVADFQKLNIDTLDEQSIGINHSSITPSQASKRATFLIFGRVKKIIFGRVKNILVDQ